MKRFTMTSITLCLAALLVGACVPLPAATGPVKTAGEWQTYTDAAVGYSIQYPPTWTGEALPDQGDGTLHGSAFTGPEGGVEVYWGAGFGGGCPQGTEPVQLAQVEVQTCHIIAPDGTETWEQMYYQVEGGKSFAVRAYTSNAEPASHDLVLQVLATLTFMQPAGGGWQTYTEAEAGYTIQTPQNWESSPLPDQNDGAIHARSFIGPEGGVQVYWGVGFGGACPEGTVPVQLAQGEAQACHSIAPDGTETWEQMGYQVEGGNAFSVRAYTTNADPASHDLILQVLGTLTFLPPAQPKTAGLAPADTTGLRNPASQNCLDQGGTLIIEERGDGGQLGVCAFENNLQCEEWALMRGECPVGGVKVTGYATLAGRYCAITGGEYAVTANSGQADEQGTCTLPGGVQCGATEFFNGTCDASTGKMPNTSGLILTPPAAEVCNGMAQALSEALARASTKHMLIEVTQAAEPVPITDMSTGAEGTACRAQAAGTGEDFASPDAVMNQISAVLTGGGWQEDKQAMAAGGPTGEGWGFHSGDLAAMAVAMWLPDPAANCPTDQPIPECKLTPSQQLYTITLDTAQSVKQAPVVLGVQPAPAPKGNPAATNCINVGGTPKNETRPDGGQYGVCYFGDNYVCEQWALMHGECPVGGVKVTGYNTPAARYCAITGGEYTLIGTTNTEQEAGICTLPSGKVCDADEYYNGACSSSSPEPAPPTAVPPIGKPNPASQYCTSVGGTLKIEQRDDVGQIGVCYFGDNKQCEEWALENGYCPVGGVKVTGYNTPAARFCAITGGSYTSTGMTPDGQEDGNCVLPNGEVCGVWQYYNGYCGTTF
jgi:putative hemolysin